jgi:hypothetical protein
MSPPKDLKLRKKDAGISAARTLSEPVTVTVLC